MIDSSAESSEPLFEHHAADIEAIGKVGHRILLSVMGEGGHQREDIVIPYPILVVILVITGKDIFTVFGEADHPMQDKLIGFATYIKRDVILFQLIGLLGKGHLIVLAIEHREHTGAGGGENQLLPSVKALLHHRDKIVGRDELTQ